MKRDKHNRVTRLVLGREYDEIHQWLDETFPAYVKTNPYRHWIERHNLQAIKEKYNDPHEYSAALFHIICDWLSHFGVVNFPPTPEHVENNLIQIGAIKIHNE